MTQINRTLNPSTFRALLCQFDTNKDGKIDRQDLKQQCDRFDESEASPTPAKAQAPTRCSNAYSKSLRTKMEEMKSQHTQDKKDASKAWESDDLARSLVLNHPRLFQKASFQDKVVLLTLLRDAGAGKFAFAAPRDQEAILKVLASVDPAQRASLLKAAGGTKAFLTLMNGDKSMQFKELISNTSHTTTSRGCKNVSRILNDGLQQHSGYQSGMNDLRQASSEVSKLWKKYKSETDKDKKKEIMIELQRAQQWEQQVYQMLTTMLKSQHQIAMGIIRNMP